MNNTITLSDLRQMTPEERKRLLYERINRRRARAEYKETPLSKPRMKSRKGWSYCERRHELGVGFVKTELKEICYECHHILPHGKAQDQTECPNCGGTNIMKIGPIARLPRKNASKHKWDEFWKHCGQRCAGACR